MLSSLILALGCQCSSAMPSLSVEEMRKQKQVLKTGLRLKSSCPSSSALPLETVGNNSSHLCESGGVVNWSYSMPFLWHFFFCTVPSFSSQLVVLSDLATFRTLISIGCRISCDSFQLKIKSFFYSSIEISNEFNYFNNGIILMHYIGCCSMSHAYVRLRSSIRLTPKFIICINLIIKGIPIH